MAGKEKRGDGKGLSGAHGGSGQGPGSNLGPHLSTDRSNSFACRLIRHNFLAMATMNTALPDIDTPFIHYDPVTNTASIANPWSLFSHIEVNGLPHTQFFANLTNFNMDAVSDTESEDSSDVESEEFWETDEDDEEFPVLDKEEYLSCQLAWNYDTSCDAVTKDSLGLEKGETIDAEDVLILPSWLFD